jgi:serine/alanine adding enzyme
VREVEPAAWDGLLEELGLADAYLRRAYVESACVLEPGRPFLLEHGGTVFAAIQREDPVDVVTPYGYGGPAGGELAAFWPAYEGWCAGHGVVTTFIRFHPLLRNQRDATLHVEPLAPTIGWRLTRDDLLAGMHSKHRNAVRRAAAAGGVVTAAEGLGEFVPLYEATMLRAGAAPFYFFAPAYWEALERLGGGLVRFDALLGDEIVASALCLASAPWLHYHLGATAEAGRATGATTLLLFEAARWGQERGYERFHLGGGLGGRRDSLHEFKRRFDPDALLEAAVGKAVHDEAAYRRLTGGDAGFEGFFPSYRAPADSVR